MPDSTDRPRMAIAFILIAATAISVNDMLIKFLSAGYPLHQMVFLRSAVGLVFSFGLLMGSGGLRSLYTKSPGLHILRGMLLVIANILFFAGLAMIPLADATAIFFVAPLFITLLAIPILGETVGPRRLGAIVVGLIGVLIMVRPGATLEADAPPRIMSSG